MKGLRIHERDRELPARGGDPELRPPGAQEIAQLVSEHLVADARSHALHAEWVFARWKPSVSISSGYRVRLDGGDRELHVHYKRYAGDKARALLEREVSPVAPSGFEAGLAPCAVLPERAACLWAFPVDRELPGLARLFDLRRTSRAITEIGLYPGLKVRPGPSRLEVLRYKPERRAVVRLDLRLRPLGGGPRTKARLLARVHPPGRAVEIAVARRALRIEGAKLLPGFLGAQERRGILFEEWLDVSDPLQDQFEHAWEAGRVLARLHAAPSPDLARPPRPHACPDVLLVPSLGLRDAAGAIPEAPSSSRSGWIHADFHADQVVQDLASNSWRLLDLDELRTGDPVTDLASWIADHLADRPETELHPASRDLLAGYIEAGGQEPDGRMLAAYTALELRDRAGGALRRLEKGAPERAAELLDRARDLAPRGTLAP